jgi:hypothetical protein
MRAVLSMLLLLGCVSLLTTRPLIAKRAANEPPVPVCIHFWPEARYRALGYDHVVHIKSACSADAHCKVSTDVNTEPLDATVPAHAEVEVVTWVGSPAREFTPTVTCHVPSSSSSSSGGE